jgi:hypothetical protein
LLRKTIEALQALDTYLDTKGSVRGTARRVVEIVRDWPGVARELDFSRRSFGGVARDIDRIDKELDLLFHPSVMGSAKMYEMAPNGTDLALNPNKTAKELNDGMTLQELRARLRS